MAPRSSDADRAAGGLAEGQVAFDRRFIVDNENANARVGDFLAEWCERAERLDIATGYFGIGAFRRLRGAWLNVSRIRILMDADIAMPDAAQFEAFLGRLRQEVSDDVTQSREDDPLAMAVPGMAQAIADGRLQFRIYRRDKFHAKAFIAGFGGRAGGAALVGSSNFTGPGIAENIELNLHVADGRVAELQAWFDRHWDLAEDVTPLVREIVRPAAEPPSPFLVYLKSLHALFEARQMPADAWETIGADQGGSHLFGQLDRYQQDGYRALVKIANLYGGAFLCDGVGLGKTFVGMMTIERLVALERKKVVLLVPKSAREAVWQPALARHLPHIAHGELGDMALFNHTDLQASSKKTRDRLAAAFRNADAVVIDEAHAFRNPGLAGKSRYWRLMELAQGKQVFLLTATPVNNRLWDLKHLIDLFAQRREDYFATTLGIANLTAHFRRLERALEVAVLGHERAENDDSLETDIAEADRILKEDKLVAALVVQRSRTFVRRSQERSGGGAILFPERAPPAVAPYSLARTFGQLLDKFERAFQKPEPLLSLALYTPLAFARDPARRGDSWTAGRQRQVVSLIRIQLLKRLESSIAAFDMSCRKLLLRLMAFLKRQVSHDADAEKRWENWLRQHHRIAKYAMDVGDHDGEEDGDAALFRELYAKAERLSNDDYDVAEMVRKTYADLDQIADFLVELMGLAPFGPAHDDKVRALIALLREDKTLAGRKVLIFSEFKDTARYVARQLVEARLTGVAQIDSDTEEGRASMITRFSPYYNESSSARLTAAKQDEIQILVSTDVLAEGLNLQDATRLINYDLHWNPVRLMQRIGRVDRRMNEATEAAIVADRPKDKADRGHVRYWNFLPPDELDRLIGLYKRLTGKVLRISKVFGIEGRQLLASADDYEMLRDFNHMLENSGNDSISALQQHYDDLCQAHADCAEQARRLPDGALSGREHPMPGRREIFLCYAVPGPERTRPGRPVEWSIAAGRTEWVLFDPAAEQIFEPAKIDAIIRCQPKTAYLAPHNGDQLRSVRRAVERDLKTRLASQGAPADVKPLLVGWMALE